MDLVKQAQPMFNTNPGIRGGISGSYPTESYIYMAYPNWSVKFYVDALLKKKHITRKVEENHSNNS